MHFKKGSIGKRKQVQRVFLTKEDYREHIFLSQKYCSRKSDETAVENHKNVHMGEINREIRNFEIQTFNYTK